LKKGTNLTVVFETLRAIQIQYLGPENNHLAKVPLSNIVGFSKAIMSAAKIPKKMGHLFWTETFQSATLMDGLIVVEVQGNKKNKI
jgi:hypothetical protein